MRVLLGFGVVGGVPPAVPLPPMPRARLGLPGEGSVWLMDVKCARC